MQVCGGWDSSLWAEDGDEGRALIRADDPDSPVRRRAQQRQNRARGPLNRSCSVPDSNNPPCFCPRGDMSVPVCDLTEIGAEEPSGRGSTWSSRRDRFHRGQSCDSCPLNNAEETLRSGDEDTSRTFPSEGTKVEAPQRAGHGSDRGRPDHGLHVPNNHMTKSMLCLNEESQDEVSWILNLRVGNLTSGVP